MGVALADVEDVSAELFLAVHKNLADYDPRRPIKPWLFGFCFRFASDYRRHARVRARTFAPDDAGLVNAADERGEGADIALDRKRANARVRAALATIEIERSAVLVAHELEGIPIPEVARSLGIPLGTAYNRLRLARRDLAQALHIPDEDERNDDVAAQQPT